MNTVELVERLRSFAQAYPTEVFPEVSKEERAALHRLVPGLQDRIAAAMGRHLAEIMLEAADALELKRGEPPHCSTCDCSPFP